MPSTVDLLDLSGVAQRASSYRFDLLDKDERKIGELNPLADAGTPTITHDSSRPAQRDVANLNLAPPDRLAVNPLSDRIKPYMLLEDGTEWPLGVFLFADPSEPSYGWGDQLSSSLIDKGLILDQALEHSVGVKASSAIRDAIRSLLEEVGVDAVVESPIAGEFTGSPMSWPAGTSRLQVLTELCTVGGYLRPCFDHHGLCNVRQVFNPDEEEPAATYEPGRNIFAGSVVSRTDLSKAPNRFVVIASSTNQSEIVGVFDVPASAPHSFFNRGFRVVEVFNAEGLENNGQAEAAARAYAVSRSRDARVEHVTFSGPPDPRHDCDSTVTFLGSAWLEVSWSLPLTSFGPMTHTLRRVDL